MGSPGDVGGHMGGVSTVHSSDTSSPHAARYLRAFMEGKAKLSRVPSPWLPFHPLLGHEQSEEVDLRHDKVASLVPVSALAYIREQEEDNLRGTAAAVAHCAHVISL